MNTGLGESAEYVCFDLVAFGLGCGACFCSGALYA